MHKMPEEKPASSDVAAEVGTSDREELATAKLPQGYNTKINIRIVPGRDFRFTPEVLGCQPRQGTSRRDAEPVALPESLVSKLRDANDKVINWLGRDTANAQLFLANPVEALMNAGVELTRSEQKTLERAHRNVKEASVVAPGVNITDLSASAYPRGRVGGLRPGLGSTDARDEASGYGPQRRG